MLPLFQKLLDAAAIVYEEQPRSQSVVSNVLEDYILFIPFDEALDVSELSKDHRIK